MDVARLVVATSGVLILPVAMYVAGRWKGQPWLAGLGILASLAQLGLDSVATKVIDAVPNQSWFGENLMGDFVALVGSIQRLIFAAIVGALVLVVAHSRRTLR